MKTIRALSVALGLFIATNAHAANGTLSLGVHFLDDVVGSALASTDSAGFIPQSNWNNGSSTSGFLTNLNLDLDGGAVGSTVSVSWSGSPNTWASTGRSENNNNFSGADRLLMTGYLDTNNESTTTITISGLPASFTTAGYDVIVYALGGVGGRGGNYTINGVTKLGNSDFGPSTFNEDFGVDFNDAGNYLRFNNLNGTDFTLLASTIGAEFPAGGTSRAPVNGIEVVAHVVPEPISIGIFVAGASLLVLRRRRR